MSRSVHKVTMAVLAGVLYVVITLLLSSVHVSMNINIRLYIECWS